MKTSTVAVVVLIIIVVLGLGAYVLSNKNAPAAPVDQTAVVNNVPTPTDTTTNPASAPMSATVTYGPNGFSPASVTIAKGGTVTWVAAAGADELWVASNPHPTHEGYDGTTRAQHCAAGYSGATPFDQCATGTTYSFTFNQAGTWGYHNHGNHSDTGTVVVQ